MVRSTLPEIAQVSSSNHKEEKWEGTCSSDSDVLSGVCFSTGTGAQHNSWCRSPAPRRGLCGVTRRECPDFGLWLGVTRCEGCSLKTCAWKLPFNLREFAHVQTLLFITITGKDRQLYGFFADRCVTLKVVSQSLDDSSGTRSFRNPYKKPQIQKFACRDLGDDYYF